MAETKIALVRKIPDSTTREGDDDRTVVAEVTTATVDRDGDVVLPKGARIDAYLKNPVVLWAHDYRGLPIGRNIWLRKTKRGIVAKTRFATHPFAEEVYRAYKDGLLRAWSIGFIIHDEREVTDKDLEQHPEWKGARRLITDWELLEYSAVPVPANPEALTDLEKRGILPGTRRPNGARQRLTTCGGCAPGMMLNTRI